MSRPTSIATVQLPESLLRWSGYAVVLAAIAATAQYSYVLFHTLIEVFRIVVIFGIAAIAWNARREIDNPFLLVAGLAYPAVGILELLHTLSYKGMGVFPADANLPTQFWIAFRGYESAAMLFAASFLGRPAPSAGTTAVGFMAIGGALGWLVLTGRFPDCFIEGSGLTAFKIAAEYVIAAAFVATLVPFQRHRNEFDADILVPAALSMATGAAAELAFTQYVSVFGGANYIGHLLLLTSTYFLYRALLIQGIRKPQLMLFQHLTREREVLAQSEADLAHKVAERTTEVSDANRRLEAELVERRRSEALYRGLVESQQELILRMTPAGQLGFANDAFCRAFGCAQQDLRGSSTFASFVTPEDLPQARSALDGLETPPHRRILELRNATLAGQRWIEWEMHAILDSEGRIAEIQAVGRDIHDRKTAEEQVCRLNEQLEQRVAERTAQLEALNKELEAFSYSVSHDLRTPLRAIDGFSQMLVKRYGDRLDDEGRRLLRVVRDNTARMGQLIDDILSFSRAGRLELRQSAIDMEALVRDVWRDLADAAAGRDIRLDLHPLPATRGDATMIRQVLINLLGNAVKFTRPRTVAHIEVGGGVDGNECAYYVADDGVGFDDRYIDKLFGVFQRLHGIEEFEGTGIGLAIVKRIVARHGGRVWAQSKVDAGATFHFTLPAPN